MEPGIWILSSSGSVFNAGVDIQERRLKVKRSMALLCFSFSLSCHGIHFNTLTEQSKKINMFSRTARRKK